MTRSKSINLEGVLKTLEFDSNSPSGFKRRVDWLCGKSTKRYVREKAGTYTGGINKNGYYVVYADGKNLLAHRIIATIFGLLTSHEDDIDHIDGVRSNNDITNLRCVPRSKNARNRKMPITNTSGVLGVSKNSSIVKGITYERWVAQWKTVDGKPKLKSFSIKKYGEYEAFKLACEFRKQMIELLNLDGAGYSERHGETI